MARQKYDDAIQTGKRIRLARIEKGLSMEQLGERLTPPASKGAVSNWENGYNLPNNTRLMQLCDALDVSTIYLLSGNYMARDIHLMPEKERNKIMSSFGTERKKSDNKLNDFLTDLLKNLDVSELSFPQKMFLLQNIGFMYNYNNINDENFLIAFSALFRQLNNYYDDLNDKNVSKKDRLESLQFYNNDLSEAFSDLLNELYDYFKNSLENS